MDNVLLRLAAPQSGITRRGKEALSHRKPAIGNPSILPLTNDMMANLVDFGFRTNQVLVQECLAEQEPWETSPADGRSRIRTSR
jgi:hypothetical protein